MSFKRISVEQGMKVLSENNPLIVDVRDLQSFQAGHIEHALNINNSNITEFIDGADKTIPLLVYCYHGNMSQGAADYFVEQGFLTVYSIDGGFEEWRQKYK